jgi:hypothetical protein
MLILVLLTEQPYYEDSANAEVFLNFSLLLKRAYGQY